MKRIAILALAGSLAFMAGCAGADYQKYLEAQTDLIKAGQKPILVIKAQPGQQISGLDSIEVNAPSGGPGVANLQPPRSEWAGVVRDVGVAALGAASGVATTGLIVGGVKSLGSNIEHGSTAGYAHVQAPGATSSTTNTVSGTGAIGGGYTATTSTTSATDSHAVSGSNNPVTHPVVAAP